MPPDFDRFFRDYAEAYNRSLGERVDYDAISAAFTDCFVAAGPDGVSCGQNDDGFREALDKGYAFYKSIGTRKMSVRRVDVMPIDDRHHMAKVHYHADYQNTSGEAISIDFDVTYVLQTRDGRPRIFAFVAGDEMGVYRLVWARGLTRRDAGGRVWLRSTGRRVKSPLPLHSGLRLRVHDDAQMVAPRGFDPRFPAHRAGALATRRRGMKIFASPKSFAGEGMTRAGLEIAFKGFRFRSVRKGNICNETPRSELRCVRRLAVIVILKSAFEIGG